MEGVCVGVPVGVPVGDAPGEGEGEGVGVRDVDGDAPGQLSQRITLFVESPKKTPPAASLHRQRVSPMAAPMDTKPSA